MLLVLEVDASATLSLQVTGQPRINWFKDAGQTTSSWLEADGIWDDRTPIASVGRNFWELRTNTSQEYTVTVATGGLSLELERPRQF
jgi:hypothetical protein